MTEFSRIYDLSLSSVFIGSQSITASEEECRDLAVRFRILDIEHLSADFHLFHDTEDHCFRVKGTINAKLTQASVVSLTPVKEIIQSPLHIKIRIDGKSDDDNEGDEGTEDIEYIQSTKVDIGEIVAQYLSLSMEPYPKTDDEKKRDIS